MGLLTDHKTCKDLSRDEEGTPIPGHLCQILKYEDHLKQWLLNQLWMSVRSLHNHKSPYEVDRIIIPPVFLPFVQHFVLLRVSKNCY